MWQERMLGFKEREKRGCHQLLLMLPISFRKGKGARGAIAEHDSGPLLLALSLQAPQTVPAFPKEPVLIKLGTKEQGKRHSTCWPGPGCLHLSLRLHPRGPA